MHPKSPSRPSGQDSPGASPSTTFKASARPSAADPKTFYRSMGLPQDSSQAQFKKATEHDLPLDPDSAILERDLSAYMPPNCKDPTPPEWPTGTEGAAHYQQAAKFMNSVLSVAREAHTKFGKSVEYCALDSLYTEQFRRIAYDKHLMSDKDSDKELKPDLVGCKLNDLSVFDDGTQALVLHPKSSKKSNRVQAAHLITFGEVIKDQSIYEAVLQASTYGRATFGSHPNRCGVRFVVISLNGTKVQAAIGEMDMASIHLTHIHNLKDDYEYTRFWRLLAGMYCSPIDDAGCNRRMRFYSNEAGNMVPEKWSYPQGVWRCVEKRLCNRNSFWSRTTRVDALHSAESRKITEYQFARPAPLKKRKKEEDTITQPTKRGKSGQSSMSAERRVEATHEPNQSTASKQGSGVAVSSPLFNHGNIQPFDAPPMTVIVQSSTKTEHKVQTDIYIPITRHNDPERQVYQFLEKVLDHNQSMLGIARFASRRQGRPTRAVSCGVGESGEKFYRIGLRDSDELTSGNDLLQKVTGNLKLSKHVILDSLPPRQASSVQPKPVTRRVETLQETVTLGLTLFDIYEKHSMLGLVKAILGALHGGYSAGDAPEYHECG
ncbi:hypothetical protein L198_05506 [Cryptococcus wingfieldii CBS 7118]|uniref:Fungal-type protein kinase domain-containing protein n=1 Tax=Cryptococcus wingfieldii CBS 7118 TaxID=1295528 RepID=A0A1E3IVX8_9TREE|nr:hypothetical protein L198_05506 [Cryptococcus wingfieldii CBS 7118]ODN92712.1 hypothetical protein L198_05506 [Cryptococcus wingfieldii CBS 7118]